MDWMSRRLPERLDPTQVLPGAATVIALGIAYRGSVDERSRSPVAAYARGRDYHYAHRDGMKALRKRLLELDATLETYACVDTGLAMEKAWAERAGLGWIGKNGCLINPRLGSSLTLSVMFVDREVDTYDRPHANLCGDCALCLRACPTKAFPAPGVVDARRCVSYQSIENHAEVPGAAAARIPRAGVRLRRLSGRLSIQSRRRGPAADARASRPARSASSRPSSWRRCRATSSSGWPPARRWRARSTTASVGAPCWRWAPGGPPPRARWSNA